MLTRGHAKHPCIQILQTKGFSMGHVKRYLRVRMCFDGDPLHSESKSDYCEFETQTISVYI